MVTKHLAMAEVYRKLKSGHKPKCFAASLGLTAALARSSKLKRCGVR